MCTCPNYMVWTGKYMYDKSGTIRKPKLDFVGHSKYDQILKSGTPFVQVPCGKCLECRIQYARTWADRCVLEAKQYQHNYFVTLTYDDDHLPEKNSLCPDDMTKFLKRLRKKLGKGIRYLYSAEYGSTSWRPHYHIILFNCPIDDLSYNFQLEQDGKIRNHLKPDNSHSNLQFSRTIYDLWEHKGMISVGQFNYDTAAYVSQYVTKKCNPENQKIYDELGIVPEFIRMSRRPGIGAQYFHDHDDGQFIDHVLVPCDGEAHISAQPRYYDKLFVKKYGEDLFIPYRAKRLEKRLVREQDYLHSSKDYDQANKMRDYKLKRFKLLRDSI